MRKIILTLAIGCSQLAQSAVGVTVKRDIIVPDETAAIAIAKAVLVPIFGNDFNQNRTWPHLAKTHTFYASSHKDRWVVEDAPPSRLKWTEPVLRVEIDKKDGCILSISEY